MALRKERRNLEDRLLSGGKLVDDIEDEDASAWVSKNRKIVSEKEQAEKRVRSNEDNLQVRAPLVLNNWRL